MSMCSVLYWQCSPFPWIWTDQTITYCPMNIIYWVTDRILLSSSCEFLILLMLFYCMTIIFLRPMWNYSLLRSFYFSWVGTVLALFLPESSPLPCFLQIHSVRFSSCGDSHCSQAMETPTSYHCSRSLSHMAQNAS